VVPDVDRVPVRDDDIVGDAENELDMDGDVPVDSELNCNKV
jgi:hypothetical protein